jgi:hypothetical protein
LKRNGDSKRELDFKGRAHDRKKNFD